MSNTPFEIPTDLRDFAERSVEQARKAFEGFVAVAQKTAGAVDSASTTRAGQRQVGERADARLRREERQCGVRFRRTSW